jgi:hypothetical protein
MICEIARLLGDSCGGAFPISAPKKIDDTLMVADDLSPIASPERNKVRDRLQRFDRRRHQEAQEFVVRRLNESTMETNVSGAEFNICKLDVSLYVDLRGHTFKIIFATLYGCDSRAHALELHAGFGDCLDADVADAYQHSCDRREIVLGVGKSRPIDKVAARRSPAGADEILGGEAFQSLSDGWT